MIVIRQMTRGARVTLMLMLVVGLRLRVRARIYLIRGECIEGESDGFAPRSWTSLELLYHT